MTSTATFVIGHFLPITNADRDVIYINRLRKRDYFANVVRRFK
jgi:hypothetical protein